MTEEKIEALMVKVADELASDAERQELMAFLADRPELMKELEAHQALRAVSSGWVDRLNQDLIAASGSASMRALASRSGRSARTISMRQGWSCSLETTGGLG